MVGNHRPQDRTVHRVEPPSRPPPGPILLLIKASGTCHFSPQIRRTTSRQEKSDYQLGYSQPERWSLDSLWESSSTGSPRGSCSHEDRGHLDTGARNSLVGNTQGRPPHPFLSLMEAHLLLYITHKQGHSLNSETLA